MRITRLGTARVRMGESPSWDAAEQALWFVDIAGELVRYRPGPQTQSGTVERWTVPAPVFGVVAGRGSTVTVMFADRFERFDPATGILSDPQPVALPAGTSLGDVVLDRAGNLVAVSSDTRMSEPIGSLHVIGPDADVMAAALGAGGFALGNGPCFSPDGGTLYCSDSLTRQVFAYRYPGGPSPDGSPSESGAPGRRVFADTHEHGGIPDGATVDREGALWVALFGAGRIAQYSAEGELLRTIVMPTAWVSGVEFGGPMLDRLYVTSLDPSSMAGRNALADELGTEPDEACGHLFVIEGTCATGQPGCRAGGAS